MLLTSPKYSRKRIYNYISDELKIELYGMKLIKEDLESVAEVLKSMLEDEVGDFVWSGTSA